MVAMAGFSTDQKMLGSASVSPAAFCTTTRSVSWPPIEIDDAGGDTATVATSAGVTSFVSDALQAATSSIAPQTTPRQTAFPLIAGVGSRQEPVRAAVVPAARTSHIRRMIPRLPIALGALAFF